MPTWEVNIQLKVVTEPGVDEFDLRCEIEDLLEKVSGQVNVVDIDIA